jgi:hypothetical protein
MRFRSEVRPIGKPQRPRFGLCFATCMVVSVRRSPRCNISWAISCTSMENSSSGCITNSRVILPPCERPFAGAILAEKLSSCDSTNLNRRSRFSTRHSTTYHDALMERRIRVAERVVREKKFGLGSVYGQGTTSRLALVARASVSFLH